MNYRRDFTRDLTADEVDDNFFQSVASNWGAEHAIDITLDLAYQANNVGCMVEAELFSFPFDVPLDVMVDFTLQRAVFLDGSYYALSESLDGSGTVTIEGAGVTSLTPDVTFAYDAVTGLVSCRQNAFAVPTNATKIRYYLAIWDYHAHITKLDNTPIYS